MGNSKIIIYPTAPVIFSTQIPIRIGDINYGKHLGHVELIGILHEARVQFLAGLGYSELDIEGVGLILRELTVQYKAQVYYGQQLHIELFISDWSNFGFDLSYRISTTPLLPSLSTKTTGPTIPATYLVAMARTTMLFFDYTRQKPASVPPVFKNRIG